MELTRIIGALISVLGVVVASPPGTRRAAAHVRANARLTLQMAWEALVKAMWWRPKPVTLRPTSTLHAHGSGSATLTVSASGGGHANATVEDRLKALEMHLSRVDGELAALGKRAEQDRAAQQQALTEVRDELVSTITALEARLDASEERAMETDARALFIAVTGILLLNFAAEVAWLPVVPWVFLLLVAVGGSVRLARAAWRAGTPLTPVAD